MIIKKEDQIDKELEKKNNNNKTTTKNNNKKTTTKTHSYQHMLGSMYTPHSASPHA